MTFRSGGGSLPHQEPHIFKRACCRVICPASPIGMRFWGTGFCCFCILVLVAAACLHCSPRWNGGSARYSQASRRPQPVAMARAAPEISQVPLPLGHSLAVGFQSMKRSCQILSVRARNKMKNHCRLERFQKASWKSCNLSCPAGMTSV